MKVYTLEQLAQHYEMTQSNVQRYVSETDYVKQVENNVTLMVEIDELKAQIEQLLGVNQLSAAERQIFLIAARDLFDSVLKSPVDKVGEATYTKAVLLKSAIYQSNPSQCLAERDAGALRDFVDGAINYFNNNEYRLNGITIKYYLDIYLANKLRQQSKENT